MEIIEFNAKIKDGVIRIPPDHTQEFAGKVKVIIMSQAKDKGPDIIEELMDNPIKIKDFKPMTRDEIYEGR